MLSERVSFRLPTIIKGNPSKVRKGQKVRAAEEIGDTISKRPGRPRAVAGSLKSASREPPCWEEAEAVRLIWQRLRELTLRNRQNLSSKSVEEGGS